MASLTQWVPHTDTVPYASHYLPSPLGEWDLVRFLTPGDGSCLFHALVNGFFTPYHQQRLGEEDLSRRDIVSRFRRELSQRLEQPHPSGGTYYSQLNRGNTAEFAETVPEFRLEAMRDRLNSSAPIGYGYLELIGEALNKDLFVLTGEPLDLYPSDELPLIVKGGRPALILYYQGLSWLENGHYELVGLRRPDGGFDTHFGATHPLILELTQRVRERTG
jgi:hypothetical protein